MMQPLFRSARLVATALFLFSVCPSEQAAATVIEQDADFVALNQNPFASGPSTVVDFQQAITLPTLRTDFPAVTIPAPIPPATFQFGASVTGDMDLAFYGSLNPGQLNINYPVATTFTIPDGLRIGQTFSLGTTSAVAPSGFSQVLGAPVTTFTDGVPRSYLTVAQAAAGAPSLTTSNPGIAAGVDLDITNHNFLSLQGCLPILGCADILKQDLPSLGQQTITLLSASTVGNVQVLPGVPGAAQTFSLPTTIPLGTFANITVNPPNLAQTGVLTGTNLMASTTSNVASLNLSIDGLISSTVLNPLLLPPLTGSVGPIDYSLLQATASLNGGLFQNLNFADNGTQITLIFDHLVRARVNGVDLGAVSQLSFMAGDNLQLSPLGFIATLHVQPILTLKNNLANTTGVSLSGELQASALSASLDGLGSIGPLVQGDTVLPLGQFPVIQNNFGVDMKPIFGAPFDINFGANLQGLSLQMTEISDDGNGHVTYQFNVTSLGQAVGAFDVTGRNQFIGLCTTCDISETVFLPDSDVSVVIGGQTIDLGDIFCVSGPCNNALDLSPLESFVQSANVAGFNPVFFADAAPDQQISSPLLTNDFVSHLASTPDPGFTFVDNPALFNELIGVPEPSTLALLAAGLIAMIYMAKGGPSSALATLGDNRFAARDFKSDGRRSFLQEVCDRFVELEAMLLKDDEVRRILDQHVLLHRGIGEVAHQSFAILLERPSVIIAANDQRRHVDR